MGQPRFLFLSRTLETGSGTGDRKKVQGLAQTYFWLELKCWQALRKNGIKWRNFFVYQYNGDSATRDYEAVSDGTPPPSLSHPTLSRRCSPLAARPRTRWLPEPSGYPQLTGSVYCSLRTSEISARPPVLSVPHSRPWCLPVASVAGRRRALRRQSCFSSVQDEFRPLPVGSGSATADISELCRSAGCLLSLADHPGQCIFIWERARPGHARAPSWIGSSALNLG